MKKHFTDGDRWAFLNRRKLEPEVVRHRYINCLAPFDHNRSLFAEIARAEHGAQAMLGHLSNILFESAVAGKMDAWVRCAHASVDLLASCADR